MPLIKISDVKVGERFRKTFENIEELAASIAAHGQIEPIVLDEDNNLIAGERRLRACQMIKKQEIEYKYITGLTEIEKKEIELEENIQRKEFTWQEEVDAKAELHKLKQQIHGSTAVSRKGWGMRDTADALGESLGNVNMDIQLARGLKAFPELAKEKNKTVAYKKMKQMQERIINEEIAKRMSKTGAIEHPNIIHGNCIEEMIKMDSDSVDLIITDPPYGINIGNSHTYGRMTVKDTYEDEEHATFDLLDKAFKEMYRILKNNRHMYLFFAIDKYTRIVELLTKHGFEVHHIPLIWDKGSGSYPSQMTSYVHSYEPFLHVSKGKRKLNGTPRDVFPIKRCPPNKKIHPSEKPTELLRNLVDLSSLPGEKVFDAFAGSGSTLIAARECGRVGMGVEMNYTYYENICKRLNNEEVNPISTDETEGE